MPRTTLGDTLNTLRADLDAARDATRAEHTRAIQAEMEVARLRAIIAVMRAAMDQAAGDAR